MRVKLAMATLLIAGCLAPGATAAAADQESPVARTGPIGRSGQSQPMVAAAKPLAMPQLQGTTYAFGPYQVQPNYWFSLEMPCPAGQLATAGGEGNTSMGGVALHSTFPLNNGTKWAFLVSNWSSAEVSVHGYIVCAGGLANYRISTATQVVPPGEDWSSSAGCTSNEHALGGGVQSDAFDRNEVTVTAPDLGSPWKFRGGMRNLDSVPRTLYTYAVCGPHIPNQKVVFASGIRVGPGETKSSGALCPPGTRMIGGGGHTQNLAGEGGPASVRLTDSTPHGDNMWGVWAHNSSTQYAGSVSAVVTCGS